MEKNISKLNKGFIKNCDESGNKGYILEKKNEQPKHLYDLLNNLSFLLERTKLNKSKILV